MGRKSSIDRLSEELRRRLIEHLANPCVTQAEVTALINEEAGATVVSKSSVNRYAQRMERQLEKNRQAREIARVYMERLEADKDSNQLGKVVNEQIRLMCFDLIGEIEDLKEGGDLDPSLLIDLIYKVSRGLKELEQAEKLNAERESKIRQDAMAQAANTAEKELHQEGTPSATIARIKREILGLA